MITQWVFVTTILHTHIQDIVSSLPLEVTK